MLNYNEIMTILTICECRNFTKASTILYIGQPALSKKVRDIEDKLGYRVFIRKKGQKTVELTGKASRLIPILHQIKQLNHDATELKFSSEKELVRVASSDGPYIFSIDNAVEKLYLRNLNTVFKLKNMSYKECYDALENDVVDIAFVGNNIYRKNINVYPLYSEKMVFICPPDHNYGKVIDIKELDVSDGVYSAYSTEFSSWFKSVFNNERPLVQCDLIHQVERYIINLGLWSIVPFSVARHISENTNISILPLAEEPPERLMYYATKVGVSNTIIDELLSVIRERFMSDENEKSKLINEAKNL